MTSARDVIADWLHDAAIQNGFENSRGKSINDHADTILAALDSAGLAVVPKETEAEAARLKGALEEIAGIPQQLGKPNYNEIEAAFQRGLIAGHETCMYIARKALAGETT